MDDRIPLIEPVVGSEELENVEKVIESGYMTQGPYAEKFEIGFADLVGAKHAITATSCTTGLELGLEAMGVGTGDEVIVPDFTHPASANAIVRVGADPVLVDVDRETYNLDYEETAAAVTDKTAAVMPVSWGGQPLNPRPLRDIADEHGLAIVEDAACSPLAAYDGESVGSQFDVSVFSFHPRKVLTTGEGGMVTTDDSELEGEIRRIKNFGTNPNTDIGFIRADATNYRMSDILAAVGVAQLEKIEEIVEKRREIAHRYTDLLAEVEGVSAPTEPNSAKHNFQSYCIYIQAGDESTRDKLIEALAEQNIETQIGTFSVNETEAFADANTASSLSVSKSLSRNLLTLPVAHSMTVKDQHRVVDALNNELEKHR
ncbi:DegT/DnrJ/EryC1/StrS family aminotransferase [Halobellus captivus]|uniref:DegT/DnrJ/EryC1/StrS family aminotransferase n=1 Tax=Halobellus captivus TaxID=2592614 RepID=UPI0011A34D67|nr:DegT/DnrJ/EryC1/StrS family aminotransferase [Halobellus captivus]